MPYLRWQLHMTPCKSQISNPVCTWPRGNIPLESVNIYNSFQPTKWVNDQFKYSFNQFWKWKSMSPKQLVRIEHDQFPDSVKLDDFCHFIETSHLARQHYRLTRRAKNRREQWQNSWFGSTEDCLWFYWPACRDLWIPETGILQIPAWNRP